jgi:hypothetical protein
VCTTKDVSSVKGKRGNNKVAEQDEEQYGGRKECEKLVPISRDKE